MVKDKIKDYSIKDIENELYSYRENKCRAKLLEEEIRNIEIEIEMIPEGRNSIDIDMPSSRTNNISDPTSAAALSISEIETIRDMKKKKKYQIDKQVNKIDILLEGITPLEKNVIELFYFDRLDMYQIGLELDYSRRSLQTFKKEALEKMLNILKVIE